MYQADGTSCHRPDGTGEIAAAKATKVIRRGSMGKIPADHYRHTRPAYHCELLRNEQETEENDAAASDAEPAYGED